MVEWGQTHPIPLLVSQNTSKTRGEGVKPSLFMLKCFENRWGGVAPFPFVLKQAGRG